MSSIILGNILCLDNIKIKHGRDAIGRAFILTINFCNSMIKAVDHVFGYTYSRTNNNGLVKIKIMGNGVYFKKNGSYKVASMCVVLTDNYRNSFKLSKDVVWGLDIYEDSPDSCSLKDCPVFCGNGVCDENEKKSTCPMDCDQKITCQKRMR